MRDVTIRQLHEVIGGRLRLASLPPRHGEATRVQRIVTDSRTVQRSDVFWALPGDRADGADFVAEAYARGASGAVVARYVQPEPGAWSLEVADSSAALREFARWNRGRMSGGVIAVTGSVGKTTTRQMVHAVLSRKLCGSASPKNFNNHLGVPLSMLSIEPQHDFAVLELAATRAGEIDELASFCQPSVAVITRIGDAHLGSFGSIEQVAEAKTELLGHLPADGWAALAGDDPELRRVATGRAKKTIWFGRSLDNNIVATNVECHDGRLRFSVAGMTMSVNVWGRHHLAGALAAVAVGRIFGLTDAEIARGLQDFQPLPMRCQIKRVGQATLIDDCYNSSPIAMRAALELLRDFDSPGRRVVICGDMRELGEASEKLHRNVGEQVVTVCGADLLVACGQRAAEVVDGARAAGMPRSRAVACSAVEEFLASHHNRLQPGDVVLVKGSRAMAMERLVQALAEREQGCAA
ncbi:MAG TPA: UDP-N-acetylmuramoyl-tripeptide--D-alanyl-D-alanine ligase [Pirellulales bacterium]|jgi:UDP-N-acetylmuramoyl-tripeptide--D-alanyl-D-alanine ligase|nr:UDP-N-acetylmuramoyl-tripeptide--D-alanyl-D-alanine ligase [Pirellulales bacterium]